MSAKSLCWLNRLCAPKGDIMNYCQELRPEKLEQLQDNSPFLFRYQYRALNKKVKQAYNIASNKIKL